MPSRIVSFVGIVWLRCVVERDAAVGVQGHLEPGFLLRRDSVDVEGGVRGDPGDDHSIGSAGDVLRVAELVGVVRAPPAEPRLVQRGDGRRRPQVFGELRHRPPPVGAMLRKRIRLAERDQSVATDEEGLPLPAREVEPEDDLGVVIDRVAQVLVPVERPHLARVAAAAVRSEHQGATGKVHRVRGDDVLRHQLQEDLVL